MLSCQYDASHALLRVVCPLFDRWCVPDVLWVDDLPLEPLKRALEIEGCPARP